MQMTLRAYPYWDVLYKNFKTCKLQKKFKKVTLKVVVFSFSKFITGHLVTKILLLRFILTLPKNKSTATRKKHPSTKIFLSLFSLLGLNTDIYRVNLSIQFRCEKIRTRNSLSTDTFYKLLYFWGNLTLKIKNILLKVILMSIVYRSLKWKYLAQISLLM